MSISIFLINIQSIIYKVIGLHDSIVNIILFKTLYNHEFTYNNMLNNIDLNDKEIYCA